MSSSVRYPSPGPRTGDPNRPRGGAIQGFGVEDTSDNPPSRQDYSAARSQWGQTWRAQTKAPNAGWNFSVAAVDNPPPRQGFGFAQIVGHWKQDWKAQSQSQLGVLLPDATASEWITRARRRGRR